MQSVSDLSRRLPWKSQLDSGPSNDVTDSVLGVRIASSSPEDVVSPSMQSSILVTQTIVEFAHLPSDGQGCFAHGRQDGAEEKHATVATFDGASAWRGRRVLPHRARRDRRTATGQK